MPRKGETQLSWSRRRRKRSLQITTERSHLVPFIASVDKLRLAQQELPPDKRIQLRPVATVGKLQPPRENTRPGEAAKLIPTGKPLRHFRLGNDQPFPSLSIILLGPISFTYRINTNIKIFKFRKVPSTLKSYDLLNAPCSLRH